MNNKNVKSFLTITLLIALLYIALFFVIPIDKHNASNWAAFVFTVIAFVGMGCMGFMLVNNDSLRKGFYHAPILRVGVSYVAVQLVFSVVVFVINAVANVPSWIAVAVSLVVMVFAVVGMISNKRYAETAENLDVKTEVKTAPVRMFRLDVNSLIVNAKDKNVKNMLEKFAEEVKYSDPVSSDCVTEIENNMSDMIGKLADCVKTDDTQKALDMIENLNGMLQQRNAARKANK